MTAVRRVELRDGQLVRLFASFADDVDRPDVLPRPRRMGTAGRAAVAIACSVASLAAILGIVSLWIATTPGWWFCALFTAFLGGLAAALWLAYGLAIRSAGRERTAAARWADSRSRVTASRGRIIQRHVGLGEDGDVGEFDLTVALPDGTVLRAQWWPPRGARPLLQPQVPVVGAAVRVWRVPTAPSSAPAVVDALDPSAARVAADE